MIYEKSKPINKQKNNNKQTGCVFLCNDCNNNLANLKIEGEVVANSYCMHYHMIYRLIRCLNGVKFEGLQSFFLDTYDRSGYLMGYIFEIQILSYAFCTSSNELTH